MNDDFLYRLRTEPPTPFATQLKERLDRSSQRKVRVLRFGLGVLLFGTAFAMVSPTVRLSVAEVIDWIRGVPPPTVETPVAPSQGLARAFGDRKVESTTPPAEDTNARAAADEEVRAGVRAILDAERPRRPPTTGLPRLSSAPDGAANADTPDANGTDTDAQASAGAPTAESQSGFIVTGPLLGEVGTPAYRFETRRAYFSLMAWYMQSLDDMRERRAPVNQKAAAITAYRIATLTLMMPDMFAKDDRGSDVSTRSKAAVWTDKRAFVLQSYEFAIAVKALMTEARSADDAKLRDLIGRLDAACTSCHEQFRQGGDKDVGAVYP